MASTGEFWISRVLATVRKLEGMPKYATLLGPLDDEDEAGTKVVARAWDALEKLKTVRCSLVGPFSPVFTTF